MDDWDLIPSRGRNFSPCHHVQTGPGAKRPGCEDDHSPPSSAEVKNAWKYTSTPSYIFMERCLVKNRMSSWYGTLLGTGTILP
jgi:hypothetical protein